MVDPLIDSTEEYAWELREALDEVRPYHQIGGWPRLIQGSFWQECEEVAPNVYVDDNPSPAAGADEWALLLQIDSDDRVGLYRGLETLYFAIRRSDLALRRFDRAWAIYQTT